MSSENLSNSSDLIYLSPLTPVTILESLGNRFKADQIYTNCSNILVSVNPYCRIDIYNEKYLNLYDCYNPENNEPHIYKIARDAYRKALNIGYSSVSTPSNQAILISGESGAGKTEATKQLLNYLAHVSNNAKKSHSHTNSIESRLLDANPILEAFGNAKTIRNNNSSRFGKWVDIQLNRSSGNIISAKVIKYLLEESRVVSLASGERNYNVFYQIAAKLGHNPKSFYYLNQSDCISLGEVDELTAFNELQHCLVTVGLSIAEIQQLFGCVEAILHLGNITFVAMDNSADKQQLVGIDSSAEESLQRASALFGIKFSDLQAALLFKITVSARKTVIRAGRTAEQAVECRDSLAKHIYGAMMSWVIAKINANINVSAQISAKDAVSVGILDIFGFEMFETNSFEQLCINYANEKLQQLFVQHIFTAEKQLYSVEGLDCQFFTYFDNSSCLELLEKRPNGVFPLLIDEISLPRGSDKLFVGKLQASHGKHAHFEVAKAFSSAAHPLLFTIRHYANAVSYSAANFLEKNKAKLNEQLVSLFETSENSVCAALFSPDLQEIEAKRSKARRDSMTAKGNCLAAQFQASLGDLLVQINQCSVHFVRCIKPNEVKQSAIWAAQSVRAQIENSGLLAAAEIRAKGYPHSTEFAQFVQNYGIIVGRTNCTDLSQRIGEICSKASQFLTNRSSSDLPPLQFGKSKVFYVDSLFHQLQRLRADKLQRSVLVMQRVIRGFLQGRAMKPLIKASRALSFAIKTQDLVAIDRGLQVVEKAGLNQVNQRLYAQYHQHRQDIWVNSECRRCVAALLESRDNSAAETLALCTSALKHLNAAQLSSENKSKLQQIEPLHRLMSELLLRIKQLLNSLGENSAAAAQHSALLKDFRQPIQQIKPDFDVSVACEVVLLSESIQNFVHLDEQLSRAVLSRSLHELENAIHIAQAKKFQWQSFTEAKLCLAAVQLGAKLEAARANANQQSIQAALAAIEEISAKNSAVEKYLAKSFNALQLELRSLLQEIHDKAQCEQDMRKAISANDLELLQGTVASTVELLRLSPDVVEECETVADSSIVKLSAANTIQDLLTIAFAAINSLQQQQKELQLNNSLAVAETKPPSVCEEKQWKEEKEPSLPFVAAVSPALCSVSIEDLVVQEEEEGEHFHPALEDQEFYELQQRRATEAAREQEMMARLRRETRELNGVPNQDEFHNEIIQLEEEDEDFLPQLRPNSPRIVDFSRNTATTPSASASSTTPRNNRAKLSSLSAVKFHQPLEDSVKVNSATQLNSKSSRQIELNPSAPPKACCVIC
jgi:myosin heavy subunit